MIIFRSIRITIHFKCPNNLRDVLVGMQTTEQIYIFSEPVRMLSITIEYLA